MMEVQHTCICRQIPTFFRGKTVEGLYASLKVPTVEEAGVDWPDSRAKERVRGRGGLVPCQEPNSITSPAGLGIDAELPVFAISDFKQLEATWRRRGKFRLFKQVIACACANKCCGMSLV